MANMHLSELLDMESVKVIQDGFAKLTGVAAGLSDENGVPVIAASNSRRFCTELTRSTEMGESRCANCDRMGAKRTMRTGKAEIYACHAGLYDFAAPVIVDGRFLGVFAGGQVLTEEPDEDKVRALAQELGIDPETYVEAVHEVPVLGRERLEEAAEFLHVIAKMFSTMAYNNYTTLSKSRELENVSRMKLEFLSTINFSAADE